MASYMRPVEKLVARLPECERVDVEAWDNEPTFRVRNKNFLFTNKNANVLSFKLPRDEAEAVVASDDDARPMGYGLGRHGWVTFFINAKPDADRWAEIEEWIRTSYTLVAPKKLARLVLDEDGIC